MIPTITPFSLTGVKEKPNRDAKIEVKSWIQAIIRAIEEDLARRAPKCANRCCSKILPIQPKAFGWKKRMFLGRKEWLCDLCCHAYDNNQFCEFCCQIYLQINLEYFGLDGKE